MAKEKKPEPKKVSDVDQAPVKEHQADTVAPVETNMTRSAYMNPQRRVIVVAYTLRAVPDSRMIMPTFEAPGNYKDPEKIAEYIKKRQELFPIEGAVSMPYTATFDAVKLYAPGDAVDDNSITTMHHEGRKPFGPKASVANLASAWLKKKLDQGDFYLVGFNPRLFLKVLGIECSLPGSEAPAPPELWYATDRSRDLLEAVKPAEFKDLDWNMVIKARRPLETEGRDAYDRVTADYKGPHRNLDADWNMTLTYMYQLDFLRKREQ